MKAIIKISKRLTKIASFLPKGVFFADIGSDHAYLPCHVCIHDCSARAIAGEVNPGPYESAIKTVQAYELAEMIDVRLGNGLEVIDNEPVTHVVIAGMGGALIESILSDGLKHLQQINRVITQPNVDAILVRSWLNKNNFFITSEEVIEENEHIYEIIVADKVTESTLKPLTQKQLMFGPLLLDEKSAIFNKKWLQEKENLQSIIHEMERATVINNKKIEQFKNKICWIEGVLLDE